MPATISANRLNACHPMPTIRRIRVNDLAGRDIGRIAAERLTIDSVNAGKVSNLRR